MRETRHILGDYVLTLDDVLSGRDFADTIARGAYPVDLHDVQRAPRNWAIASAAAASPCGVSNALTGFRCGVSSRLAWTVSWWPVVRISATHEAGGSARGQAVCMATGHAAGTLAGLACRRTGSIRDVDATEVQNTLKRQGAILFYVDAPTA